MKMIMLNPQEGRNPPVNLLYHQANLRIEPETEKANQWQAERDPKMNRLPIGQGPELYKAIIATLYSTEYITTQQGGRERNGIDQRVTTMEK